MSKWQPDCLPFEEGNFDGTVRLFPLPDLVLFPHVVQSLHLFEERYRELMEDALRGDGLIAMAMLEPGWESDYAGRPPLRTTACLGRVMTHHRFSDGRFNLMLLGVRRVRLIEEIQPPLAFRRAKVEVIKEVSPADEIARRDELIEQLERQLPIAALRSEPLGEVLSRELSLGVLTDLLAFALPLDKDVKQFMLSEPDAGVRCDTLLKHLEKCACSGSESSVWSPPQFSEN